MTRPLHLRLDFAAAPGAPSRRAGWLLLAAGAAAAAMAASAHEQVTLQAQERLDTLERLERRERTAQAPAAADPAQARRLAQARAVADELLVPWERLFAALESPAAAPPRGVLLLAITPAPAQRSLRIAAQAPTLDAALRYAERLAALPVLAQVHLVDTAPEEPAADGGASPGLAFTVQAAWQP
jgi:hypothetical protein